MKRFFDQETTRWRDLNGCLHLYAWPAPNDPIRDDFIEMASTLAGIPGLGLQPEEYLHVTVQRLDAYASDLEEAPWKHLVAELPRMLRGHPPFRVEFAAPRAKSHAIEAIGHVSADWSMLLDDVRALITDSGLAAALTPPPPAPHFTVAYALAETSDALVQAALGGAARPTAFEIDRVALVAVDQDQDMGMFGFRPLSVWALGG